jgi:hypothetical protein
VNGLDFVLEGEGLVGFEFEEEFLIDDEVGNVVADGNVVVEDLNARLKFVWDGGAGEFDGEGFVVDGFKEAGAELVVDGHGAADDFLGEWVGGVWGFHFWGCFSRLAVVSKRRGEDRINKMEQFLELPTKG